MTGTTVPNVTAGAVSGIDHESLGGGDPDQQGPANNHGDPDATHEGDLAATGHVDEEHLLDGHKGTEDTEQTLDAQASAEREPQGDGHGDYTDGTLDGSGSSSEPSSDTVEAILADVGDDQAKAQAALDAERQKPEDDQRVTLISALQQKGAQ